MTRAGVGGQRWCSGREVPGPQPFPGHRSCWASLGGRGHCTLKDDGPRGETRDVWVDLHLVEGEVRVRVKIGLSAGG